MKDIFFSLLSPFFWISLLILFGFGIYHSVEKHSIGNTIASILLPPYGAYMGLESFWHEDNIDWEKRLEKDVLTSFYFLRQDGTKGNYMELNENMEKFNKKIREYPDEKEEYLRTACTIYVEYSISSYENLIESLDNYSITGKFDIKFTPKTQGLKESLSRYVNKEFILIEAKVLNDLKSQMQEVLDSNSDKASLLRKQLLDYKTNQIKIFKDTYKYLFDRELMLSR